MAHLNKHSIIGVFADRTAAEGAIDELWHAGFSKSEIGLATPDEPLHEATTRTGRLEEKAAHGAATGAITGAGIGALAGAVAVGAIPAFGPILAGGLLLGIVGGAGAGAALGAFAGPFVAMGFSHDDIRRYETELRSGRTIVVVQTEDRDEEAISIMDSHGAISVARATTAVPFAKV